MKRDQVPLLSVVLAVHNEAANLKKCLDSVQSIADEVVVVDGDSHDETAKIARSLGARVIPTTNKANFHINKQMAMDAAQGKLVLQLDADEVVDAELQTFIQTQIDHLTANADYFKASDMPKAWWIRRKNWFMGRFLTKGGQYPDPVIRLYLHGFARLPQKDVHEQMVVDGSIGWADGHLLHFSSPTLSDYFYKLNTYTSFAAAQQFSFQSHISCRNILKYVVVKPISTFVSVYLRHRGYVDGVPGFSFAMLSAWHFPITLLKWWELTLKPTHA